MHSAKTWNKRSCSWTPLWMPASLECLAQMCKYDSEERQQQQQKHNSSKRNSAAYPCTSPFHASSNARHQDMEQKNLFTKTSANTRVTWVPDTKMQMWWRRTTTATTKTQQQQKRLCDLSLHRSFHASSLEQPLMNSCTSLTTKQRKVRTKRINHAKTRLDMTHMQTNSSTTTTWKINKTKT